MSDKAYCVRLRSKGDCENLFKYLKAKTVAVDINGLGRVSPYRSFKKTDMVALITVDRADLLESIQVECKIKWKPYFLRLEEMMHDRLGRIHNFEYWETEEHDWQTALLREFISPPQSLI